MNRVDRRRWCSILKESLSYAGLYRERRRRRRRRREEEGEKEEENIIFRRSGDLIRRSYP